MKYPLKRYWIPISLLVAAIVVITYLGTTGKVKAEVFASVLALSITAFIGSMSHFHNTDRFFKELFTEFNTRYNDMNEFLNSVAPEQKLDLQGKQKIVDYLNLCAEEYMWVRKGRIPEHIWQSWKNGINQYLKNPNIRAVFEQEKALWKSSYYGFFDEIGK
jgi:hypothetical protein